MKLKLSTFNGESKGSVKVDREGLWEVTFLSPKKRISLGAYETEEKAVSVFETMFDLTYNK
tara:strand:- start:1858 stop:2040 length:183 start_codon:yes stop_codon:yes gene_type:complete